MMRSRNSSGAWCQFQLANCCSTEGRRLSEVNQWKASLTKRFQVEKVPWCEMMPSRLKDRVRDSFTIPPFLAHEVMG
jgi:hypothetical protein